MIGMSASEGYVGSLTDLRLYDIALSQTQIQDLYQGKHLTGSVAHYPFSETTGSIVHDISTNRNSGSINNDIDC